MNSNVRSVHNNYIHNTNHHTEPIKEYRIRNNSESGDPNQRIPNQEIRKKNIGIQFLANGLSMRFS